MVDSFIQSEDDITFTVLSYKVIKYQTIRVKTLKLDKNTIAC